MVGERATPILLLTTLCVYAGVFLWKLLFVVAKMRKETDGRLRTLDVRSSKVRGISAFKRVF